MKIKRLIALSITAAALTGGAAFAQDTHFDGLCTQSHSHAQRSAVFSLESEKRLEKRRTNPQETRTGRKKAHRTGKERTSAGRSKPQKEKVLQKTDAKAQ